jgi:hypothetical protein
MSLRTHSPLEIPLPIRRSVESLYIAFGSPNTLWKMPNAWCWAALLRSEKGPMSVPALQTLIIFGQAFFSTASNVSFTGQAPVRLFLCTATPFGHVFEQETFLKGALFSKNFSISGFSYEKIEAASCF